MRKVAPPAGFEPATYPLAAGCSNPLSYRGTESEARTGFAPATSQGPAMNPRWDPPCEEGAFDYSAT